MSSISWLRSITSNVGLMVSLLYKKQVSHCHGHVMCSIAVIFSFALDVDPIGWINEYMSMRGKKTIMNHSMYPILGTHTYHNRSAGYAKYTAATVHKEICPPFDISLVVVKLLVMPFVPRKDPNSNRSTMMRREIGRMQSDTILYATTSSVSAIQPSNLAFVTHSNCWSMLELDIHILVNNPFTV